MQKSNIDVHCHYFNLSSMFAEVLEIGWRWIHGNYPCKSDERGLLSALDHIPSEIKELAHYVGSLYAAATGSPDEHYEYEHRSYQNCTWHSSQPLITVPLMMDIFFMFDDGKKEQNRSLMLNLPGTLRQEALDATTVTEEHESFFEEFAQVLKAEFISVYELRIAARDLDSALSEKHMTDVSRDLDMAIEEFKGERTDKALQIMAESCTKTGVQMTRGYRKQLQELQKLEKERPAGTLLPFLAVDPRRAGIEELVREQVVDGAFKGVKLYPPLGYLPSHPNLYAVYRLCMEHHIPVTVHTSTEGMNSCCKTIQTRSQKKNGAIVPVTFDKKLVPLFDGKKGNEAALFFSNPANWLEILENPEFSGLRLNFAHFGGDRHLIKLAGQKVGAPDDPGNWTRQIIALMERFDNVYADISYCPNKKMVEYIKTLTERYPIVKKRLMFGTDYVMVMRETSLDGKLEHYFNNYANIDPAMLSTNPAAFLW